MYKKKFMDEKEEENESKHLNPNSNKENKNKNKLNVDKSSTLQFYFIVILLFFLIYHFLFPSIQNNKEYKENKIDNKMILVSQKIFYLNFL